MRSSGPQNELSARLTGSRALSCLGCGRRQHGPAEQYRALDEEVQLGHVVRPGNIGHRGFGLRAGGVEDQHIDRTDAVSDRCGQPGNLILVGDIGAEALGGAAASYRSPKRHAHASRPYGDDPTRPARWAATAQQRPWYTPAWAPRARAAW
jgi:hypothetical protein